MKILLFGHFGSENTGNESTLFAILSRLRAASPEAEFCCVCTKPSVVSSRYGIEAASITDRVLHIWDRSIPWPRRMTTAFRGLTEEVNQYRRAARMLKAADMFVVPGTGLLNDAYSRSIWGPYNLFKWSLVARLRGCRVLFISVGAGPIDTRWGRLMIKSALALATYRSYRDESSMRCLQRIGFRRKDDRIYPDLAFSLPRSLIARNETATSRRPVVGLGLMEYAPKYSGADPSRDVYTLYLEALTAFAAWLLDNDYDIRLLLGDEDTAAIDDFKSLLRARSGDIDEVRIIDQPITSTEELLAQLATTHIVVATRFHNILLALLLNKPVISISFHHKCTSLMQSMGLSNYSHDIHNMDSETLIRQFRTVEEQIGEIKRRIAQRSEESRRLLDEQYAFLFGGLADG